MCTAVRTISFIKSFMIRIIVSFTTNLQTYFSDTFSDKKSNDSMKKTLNKYDTACSVNETLFKSDINITDLSHVSSSGTGTCFKYYLTKFIEESHSRGTDSYSGSKNSSVMKTNCP